MVDVMTRARSGGGALQVANPVQPVGGTMGLQNANAVAITGGSISGVDVEPRGSVIYDPTAGVYSVDKLRLQVNYSNLVRIPLQNTHPTGQIDFGIVSGSEPAGSFIRANAMGFLAGTTDAAWHDYRSSNPAFQVERRIQGVAFDRYNLATGTYSLLANTAISGSATFTNALSQSRSIAGLNRVSFANPDPTAGSRGDVAVLFGSEGVYLGGSVGGASYLDARPATGQTFEFQRVGTAIFRYDANEVRFIQGAVFGSTGGAKLTSVLTATKTVSAPSTTDTIAVTGAAIGDVVFVTRGKDAWVSAANTVTFDSTGLNGVTVRAVVSRFT